MRNAKTRETAGERAAAKEVGRRLPAGWSAELCRDSSGEPALAIQAPDGRTARLVLRSRRRVSPRDIANLICQSGGSGNEILVVAPFLSPRSRDLLAEAGASYVDATGNLRVAIGDPAVFLEGHGEDRDPAEQPRSLKSLKGTATGRVVRALCDYVPTYGVRSLAQVSSTPLGTVSRVVSFLEQEALLTRDDRKQIATVDWPALITRWVRDYSVRTSNRMASYLEPRGLSSLPLKLATLERYAVTGSIAGPDIAPTRLAMIYVDDVDAAASALDLVPTDAGANVWLLEPYDDVVFERTRLIPFRSGELQNIVVAAALSQVAADLLTSPGRGPQEGEALIDKMKKTEHEWRNAS